MRKATLAILSCPLLLALSCSPLLGTAGKASLMVSFSTTGVVSRSAIRTVMPAAGLGIVSIAVTVTGPGGASTGSAAAISDTCTITGITPGSVTVHVEAKNASGAAVAMWDSGAIILSPGSTQAIVASLAPTIAGSGSLSFAMSWPESSGASYIECAISGAAPNTQSASPTPTAGTCGWTYSVASVASGHYDLVVTFKDGPTGSVIGKFVEAVNVYDNLASDTWLDTSGVHQAGRIFTAQDLKDSLTSLTRLVITGTESPMTYATSTLPALGPGCDIDVGRTAAAQIGFSVALTDATLGQTISYSWRSGAGVAIGSGVPSGPLTLESEGIPTILVVTVTSSKGNSSTYTIRFMKSFSLRYDANGADSGAVIADAFLLPAETVTPAPQGSLTRTGYSFAGWNTAQDGSGIAHAAGTGFPMGSASLTLYAQWLKFGIVGASFSVPSFLAVRFTYNGNQVTTLNLAKSGTPLHVAFSDAGLGVGNWRWYVNGILDSGASAGTYDLPIATNGRYLLSCTATKEGVKYAGSLVITVNDALTINYNPNYADSGTPPAGTACVTGDIVSIAGNSGVLARAGYTWLGWATDPAATTATYTGTGSESLSVGSSSVTLYAVWGDTAPPAMVTGLAGTVGDGSVTLSWTNPIDTDLAGVRIEYSGPTTGTLDCPQGFAARRVGGLTNGACYTFTVKAYDSAGNYSLGASIPKCPAAPGTFVEGNSYTIAVAGGTIDASINGGVVTITGGGAPVLDIPAEIGGYPVSTVGDLAFIGNSTITSVTLPASVSTIGNNAFAVCQNLASITLPTNLIALGMNSFDGCSRLTALAIPPGVTSIGIYSFAHCDSLTNLTVDPGNAAYSAVDGVLFDKTQTTLVSCPPAKTGAYTVPASVSSIAYSAFATCSSLTSIILPGGLTEIRGAAFDQATGLTAMSIPASVSSIGAYAFNYCRGMTAIQVDPANASYCSVDGVLFDKAQTTLVSYPAARPGTSYAMPNSVTTINACAFCACPLVSITLSTSVATIDWGAFLSSANLASVEFPASLFYIADAAFQSCPNLTLLTLDGATPPTFDGAGVFWGHPAGLVIHVPAGSLATYQATPWNAYTLVSP